MDASIYRVKPKDLLALCVMGLLLLGVVMVQSAATNITGEGGWAWTQRGSRHAIYAGVAIVVFFLVGTFNYHSLLRQREHRWLHPAVWFAILAGLACVLVLVPGIGTEVNGARRWLKLGPIQVQPSELAKWSTVVLLGCWLSWRPLKSQGFLGFLLTLLPVAIMCLLVVIQDFGTAALIGVCVLAIVAAAGAKWWHLALVVPPAMAAAFWFVYSQEYRWKRMTAFLDPYANPQGEGYHMIQSLLSFATGGITGRGLGNGIQKLGYLPEDTTDFIFAVICEELGLFGAMFTVLLYAGILAVAWGIVRDRRRDDLARAIAFGISTMIALQAVINMAVATVSVPTKGLSLPLISAGGSGLVITCAAMGLLYSIARTEPVEAAAAGQRPTHRLTDDVWNRLSAAA